VSARVDVSTMTPLSLRDAVRHAARCADGLAFRKSLQEMADGGLKPADYSFLAARLRELGSDGAKTAGMRVQRTFVARSITVEPLLPQILVEAFLMGLYLDCEIGSYGGFIDDLTNPKGALAAYAPDLVLFLCDAEDLTGNLAAICARGMVAEIERETDRVRRQIRELLNAFRSFQAARLLVQGFVLPDRPILGDVADSNLPTGECAALRHINEAIAQACREIRDAVFFDQDLVAARAGRARWRDARMSLSARVQVSSSCFPQYATGIVRALRPLYFPPKKVLCTDLDDTLWGGIVGEDGAAGVVTGPSFPGNAYAAYQNFLKNLASRGVLLGIVSKNNEADVEDAWRVRQADIALSLDDFAAKKIGWQDKTQSLRQIAEELSLGLDSFVFVDDSPAECAAVRLELPDVQVVQLTREEPWTHVQKLEALAWFDTLSITDEDRARSEDYHAQRQRAACETTASSREDFLASLLITCRVVDARHAPLSRSAQLMAKTNQFNLTTHRYSAAEIERMAASPHNYACAIRISDRFGDNGVVGLAIIEFSGLDARIDSFLLSCRVIGRGIESALLWHLARKARRAGATRLIGEFVPTAKNRLCADFYPSHGFQLVPPDDSTTMRGAVSYVLDLTMEAPEKPLWITFEEEYKDEFASHS
jgi:FkbH-like protein